MAQDTEETVQIILCLFILLGILVVGGYTIFKAANISSFVGMSDEQVRETIPEENYNSSIYSLTRLGNTMFIPLGIVGIAGLVMFFLMIKESF
jgi:hypothetical protein